MKVNRFEDLIAWQKARELMINLAVEVSRIIGGLKVSVGKQRGKS